MDAPGLDAPGLDAPVVPDAYGLDAPGLDAPPIDGGASATSLVDEAVTTCVWTTACLNTEDSYAGAAPNTDVGSCIATFMNEHDFRGGLGQPWDDFRECIPAGAGTCVDFRACLLAREAICELPRAPGDLQDWVEGRLCADGSRSCTDTSCGPQPCGAEGQSCTPDGSALVSCFAGIQTTSPCARDGVPGTCAALPGAAAASCVHGSVGTCGSTPSASCTGDVLTLCGGGFEVRFDCASLGQRCMGDECADGTECTYMDDVCMGNTLRTCVSGYRRDVDCAALGGSCGTTRGAGDACRLPEGEMADAGVDAGVPDAYTAPDAFAASDAFTMDAYAAPDAYSAPDAYAPPVDAYTAPDSRIDAGVCSLATLPPPTVESMRTGTMPAFTGGTIMDGTYVLTEVEIYPPGTANPAARPARVIVFAGSRFETVGNSTPLTGAGSFTTAGTNITFSYTCPFTAAPVASYTAATGVVIISLGANGRGFYTRM